MSLPPLTEFMPTALGLHRASRVLGALRKLVRAPEANHLELALRIEPGVLSTEVLPGGATVRLEFAAARVTCALGSQRREIALQHHTTRSLLEAVLEGLESLGAPLVQADVVQADGSRVDGFLRALEVKGLSANFGAGNVPDDQALTVDVASSAAFGTALETVFTGLSRFRSRLNGAMTPLVVWPHHFDASMLWFPGASLMDETQPHLNFGFAAYDAEFREPYLYAYAYPMPANFSQLEAPAPWRWHTEGWQGATVQYSDLMTLESVEHAFETINAALSAGVPRR
jgi:hypothetical protein